MYISIQSIVKKYDIKLKGILHLGGHLGEEAKDYHEVGCENVIWVEGNPTLIKELKNNVGAYPGNQVFNLLISDRDNSKVTFNVTEFSQSSSILELGLTKEIHNTNVIEKMELTANRIDTFFANNQLNIDQFNFLNIDLQGYELIALKSMGTLLDKIDWIYTEVNSKELYKGCPLLYELDIFLLMKGFKRVETYMTTWYWGDALYKRVELSLVDKYLGSFRILVTEIFNRVISFPRKVYRFIKRSVKSLVGSFFFDLVTIKLNGRLGNHLFQYAFALSISQKLHSIYVIDDRNTKDIFLKYFERISFTDLPLIRKWLLRIFNLKKGKAHIQQYGNELPSEFSEQIKPNRSFDGFFQSLEYFKNVEEKVKSRFRIKRKFAIEFEEKYNSLFKNNKILAIHFRFGDYLTYGNETLGGTNIVLPEQYYLNAINHIKNISEYKVVVVTDDVDNFGERLSIIKDKIIVSESEIMDFQILLNADLLIISNSTFSWWAAYLNKKQPKVFAPEFWMGFKVKKEFPFAIVPDKFEKISVYGN